MTATTVLSSIGAMTLALALASALESPARQESETLSFAPGDTLRLETVKGSIRLVPVAADTIHVKASIRAPVGVVDASYARSIVAGTRVLIERTPDGVRIKSDHRSVPRRASGADRGPAERTIPEVHYEIRVPPELSVVLSDHKSSLVARKLRGDLRLETYKGSVTLDGFVGQVELETHKGRAALSRFQGRLRVKTHRGEVAIDALEIEPGSSLETYKGRIRLTLPASEGATIRARITELGEIRSELPVEWVAEIARDPGGERSTLDLATSEGSILLFEKKNGSVAGTKPER